MTDTRKVIRVFLASPGDLEEERRAVREVVTEINDILANPLGYHVDLIGWEETIAGYGRPQHIINQEVDRCELFIGMIWKRWGTPPDNEGRYTSGFHEEFERSLDRHERTRKPELSLFFKEISSDFLIDPGPDLRKVLEFKNKIISEKRILFQKFSSARDMESLARKCITAYIMRVRMEDTTSEAAPDQADYIKSDVIRQSDETMATTTSPLLAEGFEFLHELVERIGSDPAMDDLSGADVARFRLLANSISKPGNHEADLGVHDINILFAASITDGMKLGRRETVTLVSLGFRHLQSENAPLWRWYSSLKDEKYDPAVIWSLPGANDAETIGAIKVLTLLGRELPDYQYLTRDQVIRSWFSEETSVIVRNAALVYLGRSGDVEDLSIVKSEYDRSDFGTSRSALECMLQILLRTTSDHSAQELLLKSQFDSLDEGSLRAALAGFEGLTREQLQLGLEHRNPAVRLQSLKLLVARGCLDDEVAERLTADSDPLVRNEAITTLMERGRSFSEEEVRRILAPPKRQVTGIFGGFRSESDSRGKELFEEYRFNAFKRLSEAELKRRVGASRMHDDAAYFALVEQYFSSQAGRLRRDIDDRYSSYFEERLHRLGELVGKIKGLGGTPDEDGDIVRQTRELEDFVRKNLTRGGLNILCKRRAQEDAKRITENLKSGYAGASKLDAEYLEKHGKWSDIDLLVAALDDTRFGALGMSEKDDYREAVASAAYKIGRHSISKLVSLEMPDEILRRILHICAQSRFREITKDKILSLLDHETDGIRKVTSLKIILSVPSRRIKSILDDYISRDGYRYYNVIHWLDLAVSMSRDDARRVACAALDAWD